MTDECVYCEESAKECDELLAKIKVLENELYEIAIERDSLRNAIANVYYIVNKFC